MSQLNLFDQEPEESQEQPQQAPEATTASKEEKQPETVTEAYNLASTHYREELNLVQFMANYETLKNSKEVIIQQLSSYTIPKLQNILARTGSFVHPGEKKDKYISSVFDGLESFFILDNVISYDPFNGSYEDAKAKKINGTTQEQLSKWYADRAEAKAATEKAESNPETLEEFRVFISKHGEEALSSDQKTLRDQLGADVTIKRQAIEEEHKAEVSKVDIQNAEFKLHPTKHSKTGEDIFTVVMTERVEADTFKELKGKAKQIGGYYSRFTQKHANPPILAGFNFETEEAAKKFMGLTEGSASTLEETQERKETVKLSAADRLKEMAKNMREKAETSLGQDRKTNTHKRATQAGHAEAEAQNQIAFADKLGLIAEGLESGAVKYLGGLRNGKQLEQLERLIGRSYYTRYRDSESHEKAEADPITDIEHVVYPFPSYSLSVIQDIFLKHEDTPGLKLASKKIINRAKELARGNKYESVDFEGTYMIDLVRSSAKKITDKWERERILEPIQNYDRLQKMGLTNLPTLKTALRELIELGKDAGISDAEKAKLEIKTLERTFIGRKIDGFFPTPEALVNELLNRVKIQEGETVLEPSAGLGHIAEVIKEQHPGNELSLIEWNYSLHEALVKKGFDAEQEDFLTTTGEYDVIVMNPPFEKHQDIDHVRHAFSVLKPGGRLVAIMAGNKHEGSSQAKVQEFLEFMHEHGDMSENEAGAFKSAFRSTGVSTVTVYLEKPEAKEEKPTGPGATYQEERKRQLEAGEVSEDQEGISLYHMSKAINAKEKGRKE